MACLRLKEWKLYKLESAFGQRYCQEKGIKSQKEFAWLTALVNDDFALPALVLGYSLQKFSCQKNMIAFVSEDVTSQTREALRKVGWEVQQHERLDCDWLQRKLGKKETHEGYIGTHTRFHAWGFTQFSKIVYLDPDYMPMTNIDELFDVDSEFAASVCSRPGVLDPCFNAGMLVFRPENRSKKEIMDLWFGTGKYHCANDQVLLWHYYADKGLYTALPYAYNVRRIIYRPMKAFHFACCVPPKPWSATCRPSRNEAKAFDKPITEVDHMAILFWKNLYEVLEKYDLEKWWKESWFSRQKQEYGNRTYKRCWEDSLYYYRDENL
ncbi:predicted protein [Nematostella vectensis]|uniref:glycogenin glucosyltransferase n=1 Tax=Nematostella vectensis TaxID=45351 RepID=A7RJM0_NEMVE|nr:predicted protein [Nematostella vectensis]|eukprot:XP_001640348.1 predicted protein [Nematostella vectensis]